MSNNKKHYLELISATLDHIQTHYEAKDFIFGSAKSHAFFSTLEPKKTPAAPLPRPQIKTPSPQPVKIAVPEKVAHLPAEAIFVKKQIPSPPEPEKAVSNFKAAPKQNSFSSEPTEEIKKHVQKLFPHMTIVDEVPSDEKAIWISEAWKHPAQMAELVILSFNESRETEQFLQNVKNALEAYFYPTMIINAPNWEKKKEWDPFFAKYKPKLILSSPSFFKMTSLLRFYKEMPTTSQRFLGESPLVLLSPLVHYLKQPEQKKILWNTLCQILKKSSLPPSS